MSVLDIYSQYGDALLSGLAETLRLAAIVWSVGLIVGILAGAMGAKYPRLFGWPLASFAFILSGVPILVFLFWLHYPLQAMLNIVIDPFITSAVTLSIVNAFAVSEIVRRVLRDFPAQYITAAQVCGIDKVNTFTRIQFPLVLRQILPGLLVAQVGMLQATLFASLISVDEIFRTAQRINASIYKPVEIYTSLGVLFLAVCLPLNGVALWLRNKYTRDLSER
jgi:His/Glu/Gln/Arg/opine family amino acid ABC transporter permease subunit